MSTRTVQSLRHTDGAVLINKKPARVVDIVFSGDRLEIYLPEKSLPPILSEMALDIIYEDDDLLIINKPAGISVHPTRNHPDNTLANGVANYIFKTTNVMAAARAVGRLDKGTSGVTVFAKSSFAASKLNGKTEKIYKAIVYGNIADSGIIDTPIYRPDPKKTLRAAGNAQNSQNAVTEWSVERRCGDKALLKIITHTGRTHQIRVHMASIGFPLSGDDMYGGAITDNIKRPALHCFSVSVLQPVTGEKLCFSAPLPQDMARELESAANSSR